MKPIALTILALPIVAFLHHPVPKTIDTKGRAQGQVSEAQIKIVTMPSSPNLAQSPVRQMPPTQIAAPTPTTHEELMAAAGIQVSDYGAVDYIVTHESSWNADATEPNSGAHGLPQALPYSKTGCDWDDAVCQLRWANSYAISRYGGWWNAYNYWVSHHNW